MGLGEAPQHTRDVRQRIIVRRAEPDGPGDRWRPEGGDHLVVQRQDFPRAAQQVSPVWRQGDAAATAAAEHRVTQDLLQPLDLHRDR
jgi:hypothetical protein